MVKKSKKRKNRLPVNKPEKKEENKTNKLIKQSQSIIESHHGPLPPPNLFADYDKVLPGAAERILSMAENQSSHRQDLELRVIKSGSRDSLMGLIFAFLLGLLTIGGGIYCIQKGQPTGGTILSGSGLVSLVGVFIYGSRQRRMERESKNN